VKLLLFDIDGTLITTGGAGMRALNRAFCQVVGIVNALDGIRLHGKTDPAIVREVFAVRGDSQHPRDSLEEILEMYVRLLPEEVQQSSYTVLPESSTFWRISRGTRILRSALQPEMSNAARASNSSPEI
jgi:phosphoglycolate phosphatase-like HAD superfamily hydrolase